MSKKFTPEEILTALRICPPYDTDSTCTICPFHDFDSEDCSCVTKLHKSAYGLVKTMEVYVNHEKIKENKEMNPNTDTSKYSGLDKLVCPHCGKDQHTNTDNEETTCCAITECEHCGKPIKYSVIVERTYYPSIESAEN